jgi:uncharacterized protein (TIGR00369 family)
MDADTTMNADGTQGLVKLLGFEFGEVTADRVTLAWTVTPDHFQPYGIVHGGVYCAAIESAASFGAARWLGDRGTVVGVSNHTDFLRAASSGRMTGVATPIHRGRSQQLWLVEITDAESRLVARGEVRLQNLSPRGP